MREYCQNHPDRSCAVKLHDVTSGVHVITLLCLDCACEIGDPASLMLRHQSQVFDFIDESLRPTELARESVS